MNIQTFEAAFYDRLKQTPADFIFNKLKAGTDREAALYVYSISAHAIAQAKNCKAVPFEYYYPKEENSMKKTTQYNKLVRDRIPERIEKSGNHAEVTVLDEKTIGRHWITNYRRSWMNIVRSILWKHWLIY